MNHLDKYPQGNGDDLICGFPRRRTEESGDSSEAFNQYAKKSVSGDNTLICGFGGDAGSCSSPDIGEESLQEALIAQGGMRRWVFEGDLPGREESEGSDSNAGLNGEHHQKLLSDVVGNTIEESAVAPAPVVASEPAMESAVPIESLEVSDAVYSTLTKVDDGSRGRRPVRRRSGREFERRDSSSSSDDMSMASEDAVVLMLDVLDGSEKIGSQDQEHKSRPHTEICGRVYRHVPNVNYDHIPTELEIGSELRHAHEKSHNNNDISPIPTSVKEASATQQNEESKASHGPPRNISVETIPQSIYNVTSKQKSSTQSQPPIEVCSTQQQSHESDRPTQQKSIEHPQGAIPAKRAHEEYPRPKKIEVYSDQMLEGFIVEEDKYGQVSTKIEKDQRRRSLLDLDIIEEGSGDSQSDSIGLKSSFASTKDTSSDYAFSEDDAFDADIDPDIDILEAVVSRKKALTGEHAKSMAKKLKAPVRTREFSSDLS